MLWAFPASARRSCLTSAFYARLLLLQSLQFVYKVLAAEQRAADSSRLLYSLKHAVMAGPSRAARSLDPVGRVGKFMKNFAVVLLAFALSCSAVAQTRVIRAGFRANVPFDFTIGTQTFHAGTYQFQRPLGKPSANAAVGMIAVRGVDGASYKAVMTALALPSAQEKGDTKIVFKKHAGQWQLFQV